MMSMPSPSDPASAIDSADRLIAGFAALAIVIHIIEAGLPSPVPGIKPGLANLVTLIVLLRHSLRAALWVAGLRIVVGSLLVGSFLSPGFWLSLSGACGSLLVLGALSQLGRALPTLMPSALGLSLASALAHMAAQFACAWLVFVPHPGLLRLLPPLMTAAAVFGLVSGWLALRILEAMPPAPPALRQA